MNKKAPAAFFEMAGIRIAFKFAERGFKAPAARRYGKFASGGKALYRISVSGMAGSRPPYRPAVEEERGILRLKRGDFDCALDIKTGLGVLRAAPRVQTFDAFLRSLISCLLIRSGGFMLHSAGIIRKGKACLFLGKSGAGKSTLARLAASEGAEAVSDELNLVRFEKGELLKSPRAPFLKGGRSVDTGRPPGKGRFMVYGSPFWGEMRNGGRQGSWPLGGVFALKKAGVNRVSPCSKPEALRLLLRCLVNFSHGPEDAALALQNAARLLARTRFFRLEFTNKNAGFLKLDWRGPGFRRGDDR